MSLEGQARKDGHIARTKFHPLADSAIATLADMGVAINPFWKIEFPFTRSLNLYLENEVNNDKTTYFCERNNLQQTTD